MPIVYKFDDIRLNIRYVLSSQRTPDVLVQHCVMSRPLGNDNARASCQKPATSLAAHIFRYVACI